MSARGCWLVVVAIAALGGCTDDHQCVERGESHVYVGALTVTGASSAASPATLVMDDFDPFGGVSWPCSETDIEFTIELGDACRLWLEETSPQDQRRSNTAAASVEPGQTCTLVTGSGDVTIAVAKGSLSLQPGQATLDLDGPATEADGGAPAGFVQATFTGP